MQSCTLPLLACVKQLMVGCPPHRPALGDTPGILHPELCVSSDALPFDEVLNSVGRDERLQELAAFCGALNPLNVVEVEEAHRNTLHTAFGYSVMLSVLYESSSYSLGCLICCLTVLLNSPRSWRNPAGAGWRMGNCHSMWLESSSWGFANMRASWAL